MFPVDMKSKKSGIWVKFAVVGLLGLISLDGGAKSLRDMDLTNFKYPFSQSYVVPRSVRWMTSDAGEEITLQSGRHVFLSEECADSRNDCPLLTLDRIEFGEMAGLSPDTAVVVTTYHSGGTASWQYIYVLTVRAETPVVVAWLRTGSRADRGLRELRIKDGDLVVSVNDPARRQGDCCSTGIITTRYRWHSYSFQQIGQAVSTDAPL
jgi:hypothetical protein